MLELNAKPVKTIYGLLDPRSDEIFYVGSSIDAIDRFRNHVQGAWGNLLGRSGSRHYNEGKDSRIREICLATGGLPVLVVLDWTYRESEQFWIEKLRREGEPLTNLMTGVRSHSERTRLKMSKSQKRTAERKRVERYGSP